MIRIPSSTEQIDLAFTVSIIQVATGLYVCKYVERRAKLREPEPEPEPPNALPSRPGFEQLYGLNVRAQTPDTKFFPSRPAQPWSARLSTRLEPNGKLVNDPRRGDPCAEKNVQGMDPVCTGLTCFVDMDSPIVLTTCPPRWPCPTS